MVSKALMRRLEALESMHLVQDERPFILVHVVDASKGGDVDADPEARARGVSAVRVDSQVFVRADGESVDALCARAAALSGGRVAVPVLLAVKAPQHQPPDALQ